MEAWVPLLEIFLKSSCAEGEASLWLQSNPMKALHFVSKLLSKDVLFYPSEDTSSPLSETINRCMWIQTLPNSMQSKILSFLSIEHRRFHKRDLENLAINILKEPDLDFWVMKSAQNLLYLVTENASIPVPVIQEFDAMPDWLFGQEIYNEPVLPWLPLNSQIKNFDNGLEPRNQKEPLDQSDNFVGKDPDPCFGEQSMGKAFSLVEPVMVNKEHDPCGVEESKGTAFALIEPIVFEKIPDPYGSEESKRKDLSPIEPIPLQQEIHSRSICLREELLSLDSPVKISHFSNQIKELCTLSDALTVWGLIKPWELDEELGLHLLANILEEKENYEWSSHVLCAFLLPKLLTLQEPASRILVTTLIKYSKLYQRAAVDALLFPSILRIEGVNIPLCEVLTKIVKESLHPVHVSSFCQKLLSNQEEPKRFTCLPCHQGLIAEDLVWTEALFTLFQNILNCNVYLTQDTIDSLVLELEEIAEKFSTSLKFANFVLCLVIKCSFMLKTQKHLLLKAVGKTNTFLTNSILSKIGRL
ncbi:uncharacterized protein LOC18442769 isoform X1 [Amborella trichopoda]|uniref:uncharacterized protein LOC18442769 isoform X1 n=1 Tax=Amborella trichopoda TaxID=13333 RepID=UPI0005D45000|nr:uncharacterized protein LOC18442769 isoform X1 [Amborella trichopoda]|eukprot:XP_011626492.1 uncharacterized protein LOC18442769 isoform X1 [Amborella trichopoda]